MKPLIATVALIAITATSSAFAQSTSPTLNATHTSDPHAVATTQGATRAQIYQSYLHARKDGQLAYLDATVYAHN
ncbi:hypothetical protein [Paraburkholderia tropica]|uniref:hypothetical protein n=1 Tax=Paraburkholderia tropica TaxID=92647 RepID=UPI002AB09048|nr:hypothetical protein [Paraburkholderia tropica]